MVCSNAYIMLVLGSVQHNRQVGGAHAPECVVQRESWRVDEAGVRKCVVSDIWVLLHDIHIAKELLYAQLCPYRLFVAYSHLQTHQNLSTDRGVGVQHASTGSGPESITEAATHARAAPTEKNENGISSCCTCKCYQSPELS